MHGAVGDVRFHEFRTRWDETVPRVKRQRMRLRVQSNRRVTIRPRLPQESLQDRAAHALPAPFAQYRHASDATIRQEPPGADLHPFRSPREHMMAALVIFIPLQFLGNILFFYEYTAPDRVQLFAIRDPVRWTDGIGSGSHVGQL